MDYLYIIISSVIYNVVSCRVLNGLHIQKSCDRILVHHLLCASSINFSILILILHRKEKLFMIHKFIHLFLISKLCIALVPLPPSHTHDPRDPVRGRRVGTCNSTTAFRCNLATYTSKWSSQQHLAPLIVVSLLCLASD